jgi:RNA polymerase sigma-70 factor (ECF subfamily)
VRLAGRSVAEDIAQDAWIRAIHGLPAFKGRSTVRTWLCGIVVNCCREHWRAQGITIESSAEPVAHADPGLALDIRTSLERLPPGYRAVVVLHDIYGHTHGEIAGMLGIEEGTSKSQLARGRRALRDLLKGTTYAG